MLDNATFHKSHKVKATVYDMDCEILYTTPYHPENNPIEEFFSQLKHYIKVKSPQTYEEILEVVKEILKAKIKKNHLSNYFKHVVMRGKTLLQLL